MVKKILSITLVICIIILNVSIAFAGEIHDLSEQFETISVNGVDGEFTDRWGTGNWRYYGVIPTVTSSNVCGNDTNNDGLCLLISGQPSWEPVCYLPHNACNINSNVWGSDIYYNDYVLETSFRFAVDSGGVSNNEISIAYSNWFEIKLKNGSVFEINGTACDYDYIVKTGWNELRVLMNFNASGNGKARVILNGSAIDTTFSDSYDSTGMTYFDGGQMNVSNSHMTALKLYNYSTNDNSSVANLYIDDLKMHITDVSSVSELIGQAENLISNTNTGYDDGQRTQEQINALQYASDCANDEITNKLLTQSEIDAIASTFNSTIVEFQDGTIEGIETPSGLPDTITEDFSSISVNSTVFTDRWGTGCWRYFGSTPSVRSSLVLDNSSDYGNCLTIPSETAWNPVCFVPHNVNTFDGRVWGSDVYYDDEILQASFRFAVQNKGVSDSEISIVFDNWFEIKLKDGYIFEVNGNLVNISYNQNESWNELNVLMYFDEDGEGKAKAFLNGVAISPVMDVDYNRNETTYFDGGNMIVSNSHLTDIKFYNYSTNDNNTDVTLYVDDLSLSVVNRIKLQNLALRADSVINKYTVGYAENQRTPEQLLTIQTYLAKVWGAINLLESDYAGNVIGTAEYLKTENEISELYGELSVLIAAYEDGTIEETSDNLLSINETFDTLENESEVLGDCWGSIPWRYDGIKPVFSANEFGVDKADASDKVINVLSEGREGPYTMFIPHNPDSTGTLIDNGRIFGPDVYYTDGVLETNFEFALHNNEKSQNGRILFTIWDWFEIIITDSKISAINGNLVEFNLDEDTWYSIKILLNFASDGNGKARVLVNGTEIAAPFSVIYTPKSETVFQGGPTTVSNSHIPCIAFYNGTGVKINNSVINDSILYLNNMNMTVVGRSGLENSLIRAITAVDEAVVGEDLGEYSQQSVDDLKSVITDAYTVYNDYECDSDGIQISNKLVLSSQSEIDAENNSLKVAIKEFYSKIVSEILNITKDGSIYTATFSKKVFSNTDLDAVLIIAAYTENGGCMLFSAKNPGNGTLYIPVNDPSIGAVGTLTASVNLSNFIEKPTVIKAFVWNGLFEMQPITDRIEFNAL